MPLVRPEAWGPLRERYEADRPRRMLALDGGGIRGIITLKVLEALEAKLAVRHGGDAFRLSQFFDYVGGTSTGAIIAAGLARGMRVAEILEFYETFGTAVFRRKRWGIWNSLYGNGALEQKLKTVYGASATLHPEYLKCLLLVVTKNQTTDSAWPISSNPDAKYNDAQRRDCNLKIPLWQLVRASTAAPVYFPAEVIEWDPANPDKSFVFVDGGTTAYNNPAFLMARMATAPEYRLCWSKGERRLLVVSVGTGGAPVEGNTADDPSSNLVSSAVGTLQGLMSQAAYDQDVNCRAVGRCTHGPDLDREVWDMIPRDAPKDDGGRVLPLDRDLGRAFLYVRYDADLSAEGLRRMGLPEIDPAAVQRLDAVDGVPDLRRVGEKLAAEVDLAHLGAFAGS